MLALNMAQNFLHLQRLEGEVVLLSNGLENVWEWDILDKDYVNHKPTFLLFTMPKLMLETPRIVCMKYKIA